MSIRRTTVRWLIGPIALGAGAFGAWTACSSDEGSVTIVTDCHEDQLSTSTVDLSVKAYLDATNSLLTTSNDLQTKFRDACNEINQAAGEAMGADVRSACNTLANRVNRAIMTPPTPDGGVRPVWVSVSFPNTCVVDPNAEATCTTACSGGTACDPSMKCSTPPVGKCSGQCQGSCTVKTMGMAAPCTGECRGACTMDAGTCASECVGKCTAANWTGFCDLGCDIGFMGSCGGTCTGTCDGNPVSSPLVDAGPDAAPEAGGGDAGDDGGAEGGGDGGMMSDAAPEGGKDGGGMMDAGVPPAPGGADGNCMGFCVGKCSSNASGSCTSKCRGIFSEGVCTRGACSGTCNSATTGCLDTCNGACTFESDGGSCSGNCNSGCSVALTSPVCTGTITCDANHECKNACHIQALTTVQCAKPVALDVEVAGDKVLADAITAHGASFAAAVNELNVLRGAQQSSGLNRSLDDFRTIAPLHDTSRACIGAAQTTADKINASLAVSISASKALAGQSF